MEKKLDDLTFSQKRLVQYILLNYNNVPYMSAAELAGKVGVSDATVVRLSQALGFSGYSEFKSRLVEAISIDGNTPMGRMMKTIHSIEENNGFIARVFQQDLINVQETILNFDVRSFEEAIDVIVKGKRIYIVGLNSCASLAHFIHFHLRRLDADVDITTSGGLVLFEHLARVKKEDVLIVITFPRYSKDSLSAIKHCKESGCKVITITDTESNVLARESDYVLVAKSDNPLSFVNSFVAPMALCNAVVLCYGLKVKDKALASLERLEKLKATMNLYL